MGMRDIGAGDGLLSCTYKEAVYKLHPAFTKLQSNTARSNIAQVLVIVFERNTADVMADLARGVP